MKRTLLLLTFMLTTVALFAQTALKGKVIDGDTEGKEGLPFASVALKSGDNILQGVNTDLDGNYFFNSIDPGTYDIEVSYTGYTTQRLTGVLVKAGQTNNANVTLSAGVVLDAVEVIGYRVPLIDQDNTTQGKTVTSEEIRNLPTRNINAIAATTAGVGAVDGGGDIQIRGSRSNATDYYVDGIRVQGNLIPESEIDQLQVITGGVEARYGDVSGGVISLTTKGPANSFAGGFEVETTEPMQDYGNNLLGVNLSGPILKNKDNKSILGFRLSSRYTQRTDDDPAATPIITLKEDKLREIEANPLVLVRNEDTGQDNLFLAADFLTEEDVDQSDVRPFEEFTRLDVIGKIDARLSNAIDVTLSGFYSETEDQFTPDENSNAAGSSSWQLANAYRNPTRFDDDYRVNFRFRHRLGGDQEESGVIQGANYTLQFGYENNKREQSDQIHGENYFDYGYVGRFDEEFIPAFGLAPDDFGDPVPVHVGYNSVLRGYEAGSQNPIRANYNNTVTDLLNDGAVYNQNEIQFLEGGNFLTFDQFWNVNGREQTQFTQGQRGHFRNVGAVYNTAFRSDDDIFTFNANAAFSIVPKSSDKSRHNIELGVMYEQRTIRSYNLSPVRLWDLGRNSINEHIIGIDTNNVIGQQEIDFNGQSFNVDVFGNDITDLDGKTFYREIREALGEPLTARLSMDALRPDQLSLDMFSASELTGFNILDYVGYDYLGNEFNGTFDDFFVRDADGNRTFNVAPNRPIYLGAYLQDKFTINEMIFRVGVRLDRFDANTKVLNDPYTIYNPAGADDFHRNAGTERPGNIGEDFVVYTKTNAGEEVVAYRDAEQWYQADGTPANGPVEIEGPRSGLVFPVFQNPEIYNERGGDFFKSENFTVADAFQDYEVQINLSPRLAFSFPINDDASFFAHYDVLVQRPPSNNLATALDYFYFVDRARTQSFNNPNLRPERTVDYEVGFQQKLSNTSAIKLSAYYKELRDMIQQRAYFPVPFVNQYTTFDNIDFATTKGFNFSYDLRRTSNIQINANYSLAFADGTGSDATSQGSLNNRGIVRTLFPLNFDQRHTINLIVDYRFPGDFTGPKILQDFGVNLFTTANSGSPYTSTFLPTEFGGQGTQGSINGSRLPWTTTVNLRIDKQFEISKGIGLNVYFRVSNLFDRRNVQNVYTATGSPEDPGFLQSQNGRDFLSSFETSSLPVESYLLSYQWRALNPDFFTLPRRMYLGAIMNF
ncbi:TonB-dependent receptor [Lewinellaceae bacterium SD302]|nr:TonB-dependent receptor [Lewinellaceae bacterium SD302]